MEQIGLAALRVLDEARRNVDSPGDAGERHRGNAIIDRLGDLASVHAAPGRDSCFQMTGDACMPSALRVCTCETKRRAGACPRVFHTRKVLSGTPRVFAAREVPPSAPMSSSME